MRGWLLGTLQYHFPLPESWGKGEGGGQFEPRADSQMRKKSELIWKMLVVGIGEWGVMVVNGVVKQRCREKNWKVAKKMKSRKEKKFSLKAKRESGEVWQVGQAEHLRTPNPMKPMVDLREVWQVGQAEDLRTSNPMKPNPTSSSGPRPCGGSH